MSDIQIPPFSDEEIKIMTKASTDFVFFVNNIFSHSSKHFISGEHVDNTARLLASNKRTMRVSARNHFKSYSLYAHILWKIMFELPQKNVEAHYFSFSQDLAGYHVGKIKLAISANPYFRHVRDRKPTAESVMKYTWDDATFYSLEPHGLIQFKRGIHCTSGNTCIVINNPKTCDSKRIKISSYGDETYQEYTEILTEQGFKAVTDYFIFENTKKLQVVELLNGANIKVTPDHPWTVLRDGVKQAVATAELRMSDLIPFKTQRLRGNDIGSYELGRFVGIYCGDGSRQANKGLQFVNNPKKGTSVFLTKFAKQYLGAKTRCILSDNSNYERFFISSPAAVPLVTRFVKGTSSRTKHLSHDVFTMSKEFRMGFLYGYMESDGTFIDRKNMDISKGGSISSVSGVLMNDLIDLIASLGLLYKASRPEIPSFFKGGFLNGTSYDSWLAKIPQESVTDAMIERTEIRAVHLLPFDKKEFCFLVNHKKVRFHPDADGVYWMPMKRHYESNRIPDNVYDVRVDSDSHLFSLANGIITHNCDYAYVDDPFQDPENQLNPTIIKKINEIFKSNILDMPNEPDGELHVVGTPQTDEDFYFNKDVTRRFVVRILPAINEEGQALWPEWMDLIELEQKRLERTDRIFRREYLCTPVYSTEGFFARDYLVKKVVNRDLVSYKARLKYPKQGEIIAGFDIGKKSHPAHLTVLEHRPSQKIVMIHQKWMDGWSYSNGKEFYEYAPTQLEYLKMVIENFGIDRLYYDNTRGEFESFDEQGLLPRQLIPVVFNAKLKSTMATAFDKMVERSQLEIIDDERTITQICAVTNSLEAIQSTKGHGDCFDNQTEILTRAGWKFFKDVTYSDEVATLKENRFIEYQKPTDIINKQYSGKMYKITTTQVDLVVTPLHKMYITQAGGREKKYFLKQPHEVEGKIVSYKKNAEWAGQEKDFFKFDKYKIPMDIFLEFIGYYVSEGFNLKGKYICIAQKQGWKADRMFSSLRQLPFNVKQATKDDYDGSIYFFSAKLSRWCDENLGHSSLNKKLPEWIFTLSSRQLTILHDALILGDGSRKQTKNGKEQTSYVTISKQLADQVQRICFHRGLSANVYWSDSNIGRAAPNGVGRHRVYAVMTITQKNEPAVNKKKKSDEWIEYSGSIHCVTVPNHIIYIRRNGKPVWSGNSFWSISLALLGIGELSNYVEEGTRENRRSMTAGAKSLFDEETSIPDGW